MSKSDGFSLSVTSQGYIDFLTAHFADFEELIIDSHFTDFRQVKIHSTCLYLLTLGEMLGHEKQSV